MTTNLASHAARRLVRQLAGHPHRRWVGPTLRAAAVGAALVSAAACSLDVTNPNAAPEEEVLTTPAGLRAVAIGLQGRYGNAIEESVWVPALVSGELGNTNASQSTQREFQLFPTPSANAQIEEANTELLDLWAKNYAVVRSADDILGNVDAVALTPGTRSGMTVLAKTLKAIAFGTLIESFEQIPLDPAQENPVFSPRAEVLARVLDLLASARADLAAEPPSTEFTSTVLAAGFDLPNTIIAMQARFSLAAGNGEQALAFANEVPASATSVITYATADPNPLRGVFHALSYFAAIASFRTNAEPGDARVNRFTTATASSAFGGATLVGLNVYRNVTDPIPVFTQDELTLIRAEAHARALRLPEARVEVNRVRAAAGLPALPDEALATEDAVLAEIYRQRTYSLFITGLHWADQRRLGHLAEAKVAWLPYPLSERSTNSNTPPNP
ncbi:MAG TPA: RagB/SusD family nutrient uptake outer membrane protein [Gemmatimonadaceae bacterium]|nr:RagB/SusD family nutrient uptake outer membrane protein [Gemmatimonadaceae bacterium]